MKVFISYSSRDRWIAEKIKEELEQLGVTAYLDAKDFRSGKSINESIRTYLRDCDDFLLLLSPMSLKSQWVLLELGGAMVLKKNIIPILFHIGVNEIPQAINDYIARDINDIAKYYEEIKSDNVKGEHKSSPLKREIQSIHNHPLISFGEGQKVKINLEDPPTDRPDIGWNEDMKKYYGKTVTIHSLDNEYQDAARIKDDSGEWLWAFEWLEHTS